jgi:hypothetical protein
MRVVKAADQGGMSPRRAATVFGIDEITAIAWVKL